MQFIMFAFYFGEATLQVKYISQLWMPLFFFFAPLLKCVSDLIKCLRKLCPMFKHNWLHKQCYPVIYWPKFPQFPICYLLLILRKFKTISIEPIMDVPLNVKKLNKKHDSVSISNSLFFNFLYQNDLNYTIDTIVLGHRWTLHLRQFSRCAFVYVLINILLKCIREMSKHLSLTSIILTTVFHT